MTAKTLRLAAIGIVVGTLQALAQSGAPQLVTVRTCEMARPWRPSTKGSTSTRTAPSTCGSAT